MTSPSQPLSIKATRGGPGDLESQSVSYTPSVGTPDLRAIRAQFSGLPPNIPPRGSLTPSLRPATPSLHPASSNISLQALPDIRPTPQLISGLSATRQPAGTSSETPPLADLDELPFEEKAKVLERHLVPKEQRMKAVYEGKSLEDGGVSGSSGSPLTISRSSSNGIPNRQQEDLEPFPIPYDAPGADVT